MTNEEIENHKKRINTLSQVSMASLWRNAPAGHPYFDSTTPLADYFQARFQKLGGMTPEISAEAMKELLNKVTVLPEKTFMSVGKMAGVLVGSEQS